MGKNSMQRRTFIKSTAAATAAFTIIPSHVMGKSLGHKAPSDKLNIAGVGIGGKGRPNLAGMASENIVGLCDVDWKYARDCFNDYPKAKRYQDWRDWQNKGGACMDKSSNMATGTSASKGSNDCTGLHELGSLYRSGTNAPLS